MARKILTRNRKVVNRAMSLMAKVSNIRRSADRLLKLHEEFKEAAANPQYSHERFLSLGRVLFRNVSDFGAFTFGVMKDEFWSEHSELQGLLDEEERKVARCLKTAYFHFPHEGVVSRVELRCIERPGHVGRCTFEAPDLHDGQADEEECDCGDIQCPICTPSLSQVSRN